MNRLSLALLGVAAVLAVGGPLAAQDNTNTTTVLVSAVPSGSTFMVDGAAYNIPTTFTWVVGTTHSLQWIPTAPNNVQYDNAGDQFTFIGWSSSAGPITGSTGLTVTADPTVSSYTASVSVQYQLTVVFFNSAQGNQQQAICSNNAATASIYGVVFVNGVCYQSSFQTYVPPGPVVLSVSPNPGSVFAGWSINGSDPQYVSNYQVTGATVLTPVFTTAKRVKFVTSPLGLNLSVDNQVFQSPTSLPCDPAHTVAPPVLSPVNVGTMCVGEYDWALSSSHTVSVPSPQTDLKGNTWAFDSWTVLGGGKIQNGVYTAPSTGANGQDLVTAKFLPAVGVNFVTTPTWIKLIVDGRNDWSSYSFNWGVGQTHTVTAPSPVVGADGREYTFTKWSNGGPQTQTITLTSAQGMTLTASYGRLSRITLNSTLPNASFTVDGSNCKSPCAVDRGNGATATVTPVASVPISGLSRWQFAGWADGGPTTRTLTFTQDAQSLTANYVAANKLTLVTDPPAAAAGIVANPVSPDSFYRSDVALALSTAANPGYKFLHWEGDIFSTSPTLTLNMNIPRIVRAVFEKVPIAVPLTVKNSAADIPTDGVAPGLISIYGANLAGWTQLGPANPLAQTLGGSLVMLNDRVLPLIYASATQINAQLPQDVPPGSYTLTVRTDSQPDSSTTIKVVRNAPGLFVNQVGDKQYALALHDDGSLVTPSHPAQANESITVLGTGFGPFKSPLIEGFPAPASPVNALDDTATITATDASGKPYTITPDSVTADPGYVGITAVKFHVTSLPPASTLNFKVTINKQDSNTLLFPVQ